MSAPKAAAGSYHAFMSYSHRVGRDLARVFQSNLERFGGRYPWSRVLRIFRDETNLKATPDLFAEIEAAVDASDRLILLASPASSTSHWIPLEVARFVGRRSYIGALTFSPDGHRLYWGAFSTANQIELWDVETRHAIGRGLTGHRLAATRIVLSHDGTQLAAATEGDEVVVRKATGEVVARWLPDKMDALAFGAGDVVITIPPWGASAHDLSVWIDRQTG